jgi:type II secretory pathway component PulF
LERILEKLASGSTFTEAAAATGRWLPQFDAALLEAGETSGRLPACLQLLAEHYTDRALLLRQTISSLAYPAFLFHFAVLLGAFLQFLAPKGGLAAALTQLFLILVPLYAVVGLLLYAAQSRRGEGWRGFVESILHHVPLCGSARRSLALARLASALEALLAAGVSIVRAWEMAATASGSVALKRVVLDWRPQIDAGLTPADLLDRSTEFPELFASMYRTGEFSGTLEVTLKRLREFYQDEGSQKLKAVANWTPKIIYFGVMLMVAWRVISFWTGYFKQIGDAGGF